MAIQNQVVATRSYQSLCGELSMSTDCRRCHEHLETVPCVVSGCPVLATNHYVRHHNNGLKVLYYHLCYRFGIDQLQKHWYSGDAIPAVYENAACKVLWNMAIPTD